MLNLQESGLSSTDSLQNETPKIEQIPHDDLFRLRLNQMLNQRHTLYKLAGQIDLNVAEAQFGNLYSEEGRTGIPIRLMVGLHYLKHTYHLTDEEVVAHWAENLCWQHFCGETYFQHLLPIDPRRTSPTSLASKFAW